ncbi:MAG: TAXI family TRAP transporter solute-binding subunit [Halofilum sp. (in: g-proteobacteria)]|nr:TAXI family TRAP transporter solute-binding subunit [Halofilum sp. (in: g-proteobacteria)]
MGSRRTVVVICSLLLLWSPGPRAAASDIQIGTGSTAGVYYQVGRAICRLVERATDGPSCSALPTAGSLANLASLHDGGLAIAVAQSDWQYHAVNGSLPAGYVDGRFEHLRALFSVHGEPFTLVVRRDSGIDHLRELKGRRVNLGNPGSGQRATMEVVMEAMGWSEDDFLLASGLNATEQSLALCHGRIEAMVYTVGHPNPSVSKAVGLCDATIATVDGPEIDRLVESNPYYSYTTIPGGMYSGTDEPARTFGIKATVLSTSDVDPDLIERVVAAVFDNLDAFRRMHPAFGTLEPERMISDGLTAPLHEGALRYYRRAGLK